MMEKKMKKHKVIFRILLIVICCMCFTVTGYARAGGGGSSGGSGGGSGSSSGSGAHSHYYGQGGRRGGPVEMIIWWGTFICMAGAGTIVFHYGIQKAKRKSLRSMKSFEKPGEEWNPKKMKKYVKHAYFVIQECWRRQDTSYAEKYLSKNLIQNWNSKLGWMEVNHEKPIQERVRFLNAAPVFAFDKEGEEHDRVIYLIHGRMIGYYINIDTGEVVRGKTSPETFYEYWVFIREDGRWVLDEIRQKDEVDVRLRRAIRNPLALLPHVGLSPNKLIRLRHAHS